jgi:DNA mismatch repair protein PMS2
MRGSRLIERCRGVAFDCSDADITDVRIKDHGLESIEVSDNGSGIEQADWPSIGG